MKKPHGLYLPETPHNRATTYVRNALNGKGSLPDFIAFVERIAYEAFHEGGAINNLGELADDRLTGLNSLQTLPGSKARAPLKEYLQAWKNFKGETPALELASRHLIGLFLLADQADLWQTRYQPDRLFDEPRDEARITEVVQAIRERGAPNTRRRTEKSHPIIRRNRIDLTQDPYAPGKVSLTLDDQHHAFLNNVFGPAFYARLEHVLVHHFEDRELVHDLRAIGRFLELGVEAYDGEELQDLADRINAQVRDEYEGLFQTQPPEEDWLHLVKSSIREGFLPLWPTDEGDVLGADVWESSVDYRPERDEGNLALLKLAVDLDMLDSLEVRELPARIARTLKERFNMRPLEPIRDNLLAYLNGTREQAPSGSPSSDAVDYHFWQLFKLYASQTLGEDLESSALQDDYLATLAQPMWFAIENTLQVLTGFQTKRGEQGEWLLMKGQDVQCILSNQDAQQIARFLQQVVNPFEQVLRISRGSASQSLPHLVKRPVPEFHIPVGLENIERAEELLSGKSPNRKTAFEFLAPLVITQLGKEAQETLRARISGW